jgi:hypothetical protein
MAARLDVDHRCHYTNQPTDKDEVERRLPSRAQSLPSNQHDKETSCYIALLVRRILLRGPKNRPGAT